MLQNRGDGVGTGAFAVCACYMDGLETAVGMSEMLVQDVGCPEAFLVCSGTILLEQWCRIEKIFYCFLIVHG